MAAALLFALLLAVAALVLYLAGALRGARSMEAAYRALVANLPMAVVLSDTVGRIRCLNPPRLRELTGHDAGAHGDRAFLTALVHDEDRPRVEAARERALQGATEALELRFHHADGSWRRAEVLLYPRREGSRVAGLGALVSDVTERTSLTARLRELQKMEALGAMGGGIAHDFNNILGAIHGHTELALRRLPGDHPARHHVEEARRAAARAAEHTRQLLTFSRRHVEDPRPVDVGAVCQEAVSLVRHSVDPRLEITVRVEERLWPTRGEAGELVQSLVNLLLNARDAMPEGGHVLVEASNAMVDETYARANPEASTGEFVRLVVADDGQGIPAEVQARIFEPFFTTKPAGTGLGLAIVYGTVRRHGGWVHCYSEPGAGTRFSLYLPRLRAAGRVADPDAPPEAPHGSETVLLVEDDEQLREVGVQTLEELGYSVVCARDGVEAVEAFERERGRVRAVILDWSMPRMCGRDALTRLRALDPRLPVLVTSGHRLDAEAATLLSAGPVGFIPKPYRLDEMGRALRRALDA